MRERGVTGHEMHIATVAAMQRQTDATGQIRSLKQLLQRK
jgi:hypothetical protein